MKVRIFYHHTDCGGVVYYANYLKFFEEARTEFFESRGVYIPELLKQGTLFVVARQEIDYKAPAVYGDVLEVRSWVTAVSRASVTFDAEIRNQKGQLITQGKTILVCISKDIKPRSLPDDVRTKLMPQER